MMMIDNWSDTSTTTTGNKFTSSFICPNDLLCYAENFPMLLENFHDDISTPDSDNRSWTFKKLQEKQFNKIWNKIKVVIFNDICYNKVSIKLMNSRSGYKGLNRLRKEGRI